MSRVIAAFAQFFDDTGEPIINGWLEFLVSNTTATQKATYADADQSIANANPLQLDAAGRCPNAFGQGIYKVNLYYKDPIGGGPGVLAQTFDPVVADYVSQGSGDNFAEWDVAGIYQVGQIVTYNGLYYRSITANNVGNIPDLITAEWEKIGFLRYWNAAQTYDIDNIAIYGSQLYFSLQANNINHQPDLSPLWWDPVASGTILLNWIEVSGNFVPTVSGRTLGNITNLIGHIYQENDARHYFGDAQDAWMYFNGTNLLLDTAGIFNIKSPVLFDDAIEFDGTLQLDGAVIANNTVDFLANVIFADSVHLYMGTDSDMDIYHDGANMYMKNNTGAFLLGTYSAANLQFIVNSAAQWIIENASGNLIPATSGTRNIGDPSYLIQHVYHKDSGYIYLGSDQDTGITHDGSNLYLTNITGSVYLINNNGSGGLIFQTGAGPATRWTITVDGHLIPTGSMNIGSTSAELQHIYQKDAGYHYFGDDQDGLIGYDIALYIGTTNASSILFKTTNTNRWYITSAGHIHPYADVTYDIGTTNLNVRHIYQGDSCYHYIGSDQDAYIVYTDSPSQVLFYAACNMYIGTTGAYGIVFTTNSVARWGILSTGAFLPQTTDTYNIGTPSYRVQHVYLCDSGSLYLGSGQDGYLTHDGSQCYLRSTGALNIQTWDSSHINFFANQTVVWRITGAAGAFRPATTNSVDIGESSYRVKTIYSVNDLNYTSDAKKKDNIEDSTIGLSFITKLKPKQFVMTGSTVKKQGLIAQDVVQVLAELNIVNFSGIVYDAESDDYGLNNAPFIAALINSTTELNTLTQINISEIDQLKTKIQVLEAEIELLKAA